MNIEALRQFFMISTIISGVMLVFTALVCSFATGWIYKIHSKFYPMPRETFNVVLYCMVGFFKILFFFVFLIPYVTLLLMK